MPLEPSEPIREEIQQVFALTDDSTAWMDSSSRLVSVCSEMFSRLFIVMKECVRRNRECNAGSAKYEPSPLTTQEESTLSIACSIAGAMFGNSLSAYIDGHFRRAVETGDMRAFKIRLLFLKARDSISEPNTKRRFVARINDGIRIAEEKAGCKPDHSPRRMSKWEKERKLRIDAKKAILKNIQPELNLIWQDGSPALRDGVAADDGRYDAAPHSRCRYNSVGQILKDIDSGVIAPYKSAEEICKDLKEGKITDIEALMMAYAMDKYCPIPDDEEECDAAEDLDCEYDDNEEIEEGRNMEDEDEYLFDEEEYRGRGRRKPGYSYRRDASRSGSVRNDYQEWDMEDDY